MLTGLQRTKSRVTIRDLTTVQELGKAKAVEREVWQLADSDLLQEALLANGETLLVGP